SHMDIKAISNANSIDSAIAVQTNVARVTAGGVPTENVAVYGSNDATIVNYRPADSINATSLVETSTGSNSTSSSSSATEKQCNFAMDSVSGESANASAAASSSHAVNETLNYTGSLAESSQILDKGAIGQSNIAAAELLDYDNVVSDAASSSSSSASSKNARTVITGSALMSSSSTASDSQSSLVTSKTQSSTATRNSKGANNHLALLNTSQKNIQAISNLNAVASGAAIQTNVTSNMGVSGTVSNSNVASVQSGF
ncbi:MAG: hypothetical protein NC930_04930, partial [Candidatus Omnitrophica bacterium]|nr:hypothetical protein [Candidatus Omnitrophota bacterium]